MVGDIVRPGTNDRAAVDSRSGSSDRWVEGGRWGLGAALFVAAVALPLFRQTGTPSWRTLWAEDGAIYFQDAYSHSGMAVLARVYAGYLQLPPRILGAFSQSVPTRSLALYCAVAATVVDALLAWFVYWAADGWLTSRPARVALASLVVLMPALGQENTATITNIIWAFAAAAPWALLSMAERPRAVVLRSFVAFFAATATALSMIFVPLAFGCALVRRTRATWVVVTTFCVGLLVQAAVVSHTSDQRIHFLATVRQASKLPELISLRVFAEYLLSDKGISWLWSERGVLAALAPLVVVAILMYRFPGAIRRNQLVAVAFVGLSVVAFVVPVWGRGTDSAALTRAEGPQFPVPSTSRTYVAANRFSVVPVMLLAGAAALLLAGPRRRRSDKRRIWPIVFVVHIALLSMIGFSVKNLRSRSPSWSASVGSVYQSQCARNPATNLVQVPEVFGARVRIACRDLKP